MMKYEPFVAEVAARLGLSVRSEAEHAIDATLSVLGAHLPEPHAAAVTKQLPIELAQMLHGRSYRGDVELADFYAEVREAEGVPMGFAMEHALVVCQVLAEAVDLEARKHLSVHAPRSMAPLFTLRSMPAAAPPHLSEHIVLPGSGHTLASGRPGSEHPLSEAVGAGHRDSIARSDDPHADVKLSSTRGMSSERYRETLASGMPGSKRSLSSAKG